MWKKHTTVLLLLGAFSGCIDRTEIRGKISGGFVSTSTDVPADGRSVADATLRISSDGKPLAGVSITVASSGGASIVQPSPTDSTGTSHAAISSASTGVQTLTATVLLRGEYVALPQQGIVDFSADLGVSSTSTLTVTSSRVTAGDTTLLTATVKDVWGTVVAGQAVTFASSGRGNVFSPTSGTTDAQGQLTTSLSSTAAEAKSVTALFSKASANASVTFVAGQASSTYSTLVGNPNSLTADSIKTTNLLFTAADSYQNPIEGCQVSFTNYGLGGVLKSKVGMTNASGRAEALYSGTRAGTAMVVGTCQSAPGSGVIDFVMPTSCPTGTPIYSSLPQILAGSGLMALTHGDFNEDEMLDVIVANANDNTVGLALSRGSGLFSPMVPFAAGSRPAALIAVDVDRDTHLDCILLNSADNTVGVLLGNGRGGFQTMQAEAVGNAPSALASADLNMDGHTDIVVANAGDSTLSVLLGNGDGSFAGSTPYATSGTPQAVVLADVNADGHVDALATGLNSNNVDVLLGTGTGVLGANVPVLGSGPHKSLAVVDVNSDGLSDVVATASSDMWIDVMTGAGTGGFSAPSLVSLISTPTALAVADVTRDGVADIVATASQVIYIATGHGDGSFASAQRFAAGSGPVALDVCDIDGDENPDIVSADLPIHRVNVTLGYGTGSLESILPFDLGGVGNNGSVLADFDGDGSVDAATAVYYGSLLAISLNRGDGTFKQGVQINLGGSPVGLAAADFNHDGIPDLSAVWSTGPGGIAIALGNGDGTMQSVQNANNLASCMPLSPLAGDVNGDGNLDLTVACTSRLAMFPGNGDGTLGVPTTIAIAGGATWFALVDLNGDQILDVVATNSASSYVTRLGNGDGTFQAQTTGTLPAAGSGITAGDLDGDGHVDIVIALANPTADVAVVLGQGNGLFNAATLYPTMSVVPVNVALSDVNADGHLDVLISAAGMMGVMHGDATGTLSGPLTFPGPSRSVFVGAVDLNHDGLVDIVTSSAYRFGEPYDSLVPYLASGCLDF